jgi:hypothetical protein
MILKILIVRKLIMSNIFYMFKNQRVVFFCYFYEKNLYFKFFFRKILDQKNGSQLSLEPFFLNCFFSDLLKLCNNICFN